MTGKGVKRFLCVTIGCAPLVLALIAWAISYARIFHICLTPRNYVMIVGIDRGKLYGGYITTVDTSNWELKVDRRLRDSDYGPYRYGPNYQIEVYQFTRIEEYLEIGEEEGGKTYRRSFYYNIYFCPGTLTPTTPHWNGFKFEEYIDVDPESNTKRVSFMVPLWFVAALALAPFVWGIWPGVTALRRNWRLKRGQCGKCGYDLRESKSRCPECGTEIPPSAATPAPQPLSPAKSIENSS